MYIPPSPILLPAYPVSGGTCLLAVLATAAYWSGQFDVSALKESPEHWPHEPWRLLTSTLLHGDLLHLLFNVYWTWTFGTLLEETLGHAKTGAIFVFLGLGSSAAEFALFDGGIGLSGIGYGLFGFLWAAGRRPASIYYEAIDPRTITMFVLWGVLCLFSSRVANVAHGSGLALGYLLGLAMEGRRERRMLFAGVLTAASAVVALAVGPGRPYVNMSRTAGLESAYLGWLALQDKEFARAADLYESAVAVRPENAGWWHNLGLAYLGLDRDRDAEAAFRRAVSLSPTDRGYAEALEFVRGRLEKRGGRGE